MWNCEILQPGLWNGVGWRAWRASLALSFPESTHLLIFFIISSTTNDLPAASLPKVEGHPERHKNYLAPSSDQKRTRLYQGVQAEQ